MKKILSISDAASLAIHTMGILAAFPEKHFSTREIAGLLNASANHLAKVFQRLGKEGFIVSQRGPGGGVHIRPGREKASLLDVYEALEGAWAPADCLLNRPACGKGSKSCALGNLLRRINSDIHNTLAHTRLSDISESFQTAFNCKNTRDGACGSHQTIRGR